MKAWIYRHSFLSLAIPYILVSVVCTLLSFYGYIHEWLAFSISSWVLLLLVLGVRRVGQSLISDAVAALERDLDPARYLTLAGILKSKKNRPEIRLMLEANYAEGIDAAGNAEEALAYMDALLPEKGRLALFARARFDLLYAVIAVHSPAGRERLPTFLSELERETAALPQGYAAAVRASFDTVRDAMRFYAGDTEGLVSKYVATIEATRENPFLRRRHIIACMWLARVYEKNNRRGDAAAMFSYVAANGGSLGLVAEAREALCRLGAKESEQMKNGT